MIESFLFLGPRRSRTFKNRNHTTTSTIAQTTTIPQTTTTLPITFPQTTITTVTTTIPQTSTIPTTTLTRTLPQTTTGLTNTLPTTTITSTQPTINTTTTPTIQGISPQVTQPITSSIPSGIPLIRNSTMVLDNTSKITYPNITTTNYIPRNTTRTDTFCFRDPDTDKIVCNNTLGFVDYAFKNPNSYQLNLSVSRVEREKTVINPIFTNVETQINYCNLLCKRNGLCQGFKTTYDENNRQYFCDFYRSNLNVINNLLQNTDTSQRKIRNPQPLTTSGNWSNLNKRNN